MEDHRRSFLREVTSQIHSREARKHVSDELNHHVKEAKKVWINKGFTEEEAEQKAIEQMGSPVTLGIQLNKIHRPRVDWLLIGLVGTILLLGFLPLVSLGYGNRFLLTRKVIFVVIGMTVAIGLMFVDHRKLLRNGGLFYGVGALLLLTLLFFSNTMINGIPYINIGPLSIESLFALPFFMVAWACFFNRDSFKIWHFALLFLLSLILFVQIPSLSTTYLYFAMVLSMLWWSKFSILQKAQCQALRSFP